MKGPHSFSLSLFALFALFVALVGAQNDWDTACVTGSCAYEAGDGVNTAWSMLMLDGTTSAISDITPAAGWEIFACVDDSAEPQTIRLVCTSQALGCAHLFTDGAPDTVVRLPESCGTGPFARVVSVVESSDQSVPEGVVPEGPVRELSFDYDFAAVTAAKGSVGFTLAATTNPRQRTLLSTPILRRALRPIGGRRALSRAQQADLVAEFIALSRAPTAKVEGDVTVASIGDFSKEWSTDFTVLNVHQPFPLFDLSISCPASPPIPSFDAHVAASAQVDVDVSVSVGIIVSGSLIPFEITQLAFTSGLTADAKAVFDLKADVTGKLDQTIPLYTADIPGLNIPGIITLGPTFGINAKIVGQVDVVADITVTTAWSAPKVELVFPPSQGDSTTDTKRAESFVDLAVGATTAITGQVEAHIIPKLEVGLSLLSGIAKAGVFLELDPFATLDFNLNGTGHASTGGTIPRDLAAIAAHEDAVAVRDDAALAVRVDDAGGSVSGCIGLDVGFAIRAGAQGSLPPFFDESITWDLFSIKADVFDKCFSESTKRDVVSRLERRALEERATEIVCPTIQLDNLLHIIQQQSIAAA